MNLTILAQSLADVKDFTWWHDQLTLDSVEYALITDPPSNPARADAYIVTGSIMLTNPWAALLCTAANAGSLILGIAAGALSLMQLGLLPGPSVLKPASHHINDYINLSPEYQYNAFTRNLSPTDMLLIEPQQDASTLVLPPGLDLEVRHQGLDVLRYPKSQDIAALSNKAGTIMGILPKLAASAINASLLSSMREHLKSGYQAAVAPLYYWQRP